MTMEADAWFLYPGEAADPRPGQLVRGRLQLGALGDDDVLAEPLFGSWEANMEHALLRRPVDICRVRGEPRVVVGNSGVLRILDVGRSVRSVRPGQTVLLFVTGQQDPFGYPITVVGYDEPGSVGCLSTRMRLKERQVIPLPDQTRHALTRWAAFGVRYFTAWANWELAHGTFRLQVSGDELPTLDVWGWGGGSTLAELELASNFGYRSVAISGSNMRLGMIAQTKVAPLDRRQFGDLNFSPDRYETDPEYRASYSRSERSFIEEVSRRTFDRMVHIFVDYIGSPVFRMTLKALARNGVITTAGWKQGMMVSYLRARECIQRHQLIHTHYARYSQAVAAVAYAEEHDWLPRIDEKVYDFDEVPLLVERYRAGETGMFPVYAVNRA